MSAKVTVEEGKQWGQASKMTSLQQNSGDTNTYSQGGQSAAFAVSGLG